MSPERTTVEPPEEIDERLHPARTDVPHRRLSLPAPSENKPNAARRFLWTSIAVVGSLGMSWLFFGHLLERRNAEELPPETPLTNADPNAIAVTLAPITLRPLQRTVEAVGTLWGYEEVSLSAKVEGRVLRIRHDVSDEVEPGKVLIELDPTDAELAVKQAEKTLQAELARLGLNELPSREFDVDAVPVVEQALVRMDNAKLKLDRSRTLAQRSVISNEELTDRTADYRSAEAEYNNQLLLARASLATIEMRQQALAIARQRLEDMTIRAPAPSNPVPGVPSVRYAVTRREVSEGSFVRVGDEICRLVIDKALKLRVSVPERHSADVKLGQTADVHTAAFDKPFSGIVRRINPSVSQSTRTFEVEILIPNADGLLKPGGFAKAAIAIRVDPTGVTVPVDAVVTFAGITKLFLMKDGKAHEVRVTTGVQQTDWVEIQSPSLDASQRVVTSGQTVLAEGTPIYERPASQPAKVP